jgi:dipeptidyl aminopeptidase/acylaminoacyl peptidase
MENDSTRRTGGAHPAGVAGPSRRGSRLDVNQARDSYTTPGRQYFRRSPVMHAQKVKTPTLNICGALDRCTPPEEAAQFHNALLQNGVKSVLVTYPEEGHGIRNLPAALDCTARLVAWFETYMPARADS